MKMDLHKSDYNTTEEYNEYIYGSADVVGLMCLKVFVNGDQEEYDRLKNSAIKLGSAFQKVNFLRDLKADFEQLNRTYFPNTDLSQLDEKSKQEIIQDIEKDIIALGYQVVAISPDAPSFLKQTLDKKELQYQLYSDSEGVFFQAVGIAFAREKPKLDKYSEGKNPGFLPVPTVYVLNAKQEIEFIVVVTDTDPAIGPCGLCLHVISEFAKKDTPIYFANQKGIQSKSNFGEILSSPFSEIPETI